MWRLHSCTPVSVLSPECSSEAADFTREPLTGQRQSPGNFSSSYRHYLPLVTTFINHCLAWP